MTSAASVEYAMRHGLLIDGATDWMRNRGPMSDKLQFVAG
jgi:hypothetical protein